MTRVAVGGAEDEEFIVRAEGRLVPHAKPACAVAVIFDMLQPTLSGPPETLNEGPLVEMFKLVVGPIVLRDALSVGLDPLANCFIVVAWTDFIEIVQAGRKSTGVLLRLLPVNLQDLDRRA